MGRLTLNPNPTFNAKVEIPVAGDTPAKVEFTFKHRTRSQVDSFLKETYRDQPEQGNVDSNVADVDLILSMATGWDLAETFNRENVELLVQMHIAAPAAIFEAYLAALTGARRKN